MKPALCVVIHDVADARLAGCERVLAALDEVAPLPLTFLAVPRFHGAAPTRALEQWLDARSAHGDELTLHGCTHRDDGTPADGFDRLRRRVYTRGEGEFWSLDAVEASARLRAGIDWFAANGWPLRGFVAPAWLLGPGGWAALRAESFSYTATLRSLHLLPEDIRIPSQAIVYSTSTAWRRRSSIAWAGVVAAWQARNPVLRFELHPHDADDPGVRRSWQRLLERALQDREALSVAALCDRWRAARRGPAPAETGRAEPPSAAIAPAAVASRPSPADTDPPRGAVLRAD